MNRRVRVHMCENRVHGWVCGASGHVKVCVCVCVCVCVRHLKPDKTHSLGQSF